MWVIEVWRHTSYFNPLVTQKGQLKTAAVAQGKKKQCSMYEKRGKFEWSFGLWGEAGLGQNLMELWDSKDSLGFTL